MNIYDMVLILLALIPIIIVLSIAAKRRKSEPRVQTTSHQTSETVSAGSSEPASNSEGMRIIEKSKLTISIILILFFLAGIVIIALGQFADKKYSVIFYFVGSIIFVPIGIGIGAIFSSSIRIKILRMTLKKNIGYVKFIVAKKIIKPVLANLDNDIIRFGNGIYIINRKFIKRESPDEEYSIYPIDQEKIKYEEGIPTIYFDVDDIMPVDFDLPSKEQLDKYRIPSQVSATLNKEIAVEKAKVMNLFASRQNMFMIVVIIMLLASLYFLWSNYNSFKDIKKILPDIKNNINSIDEKLKIIEERQKLSYPYFTPNATEILIP